MSHRSFTGRRRLVALVAALALGAFGAGVIGSSAHAGDNYPLFHGQGVDDPSQPVVEG